MRDRNLIIDLACPFENFRCCRLNGDQRDNKLSVNGEIIPNGKASSKLNIWKQGFDMTDDTAQSLPSPLRKNKRREVPMKVLVVDDEELVRELVREAMEVQGYEAWTAANGRDALALGAENEFDLIF